VLVILGVIGLIMPIMPGWVFLIPGLVILSDYFPWAKRLVTWAKQKSGLGHGEQAGEGSPKPEDKHGADPDRDRT
jgi:uncharacterized membrane protein YbaN (DUF454 family)